MTRDIPKDVIGFLRDCQKSHKEWAEFFEGDPESEHAMVGSGEWDDAETHRIIEKRYEEVIEYIKDQEELFSRCLMALAALNC